MFLLCFDYLLVGLSVSRTDYSKSFVKFLEVIDSGIGNR